MYHDLFSNKFLKLKFKLKVIFPIFQFHQNSGYLLKITIKFYKCRSSIAAVTPDEYEWNIKHGTSTFATSRIPLLSRNVQEHFQWPNMWALFIKFLSFLRYSCGHVGKILINILNNEPHCNMWQQPFWLPDVKYNKIIILQKIGTNFTYTGCWNNRAHWDTTRR